ncbi:DHH family phosphoesterase [Paenibacillus sp.]|uniref:DHH family phosphoesterase n=1 Tax=Paenibacillus sp. TaxID=58172 RepID=UPI002D635925|nr:DHH family phosphoesterase [Paenibacillus sp.]HZG57297.1 DHH family phosphoesterase [Paenibacillus sp.]
MPKWLHTRWASPHTTVPLALTLALSLALFGFSWIAGTLALIVSAAGAAFAVAAERRTREEMNAYISTISHRVKKASSDVISEMPIGIVLYGEDRQVEWHNGYIAKAMERESIVGESVHALWPALKSAKDKEATIELSFSKRTFQARIRPEERLIYFTDITVYANLLKKYEEERIAFGLLVLDNVDEATQGMDDQSRSLTLATVTTVLNEWAVRNRLYMRRTASDRFFLLLSQKELASLEQSRFDVLDEVKDATAHLKLPMTISIGVAGGAAALVDLGQLAQTSLDIALGRGGDQVAVKVGDRVSFYGGKSNAVEKRTRVRARVISHALRDLIKESDKVVVMGHKIPDMDALGAAIGMLKAADAFGKPAYIVLEGVNPSIHRLMEMIYEDEELTSKFVTPEDASHLITSKTLAVVVDTHKASLVAEPKLLGLTKRLVVVDHHRRGEEFISEATLVYMEPYASSTCELVTELLQYVHEGLALGVLEATAMLAGIVTDTKSFSVRTGSRTFEAASYLRRNGADAALIQRLLKDDLPGYLMKADIIRHARIVHKHFAVAVTQPGQRYPQLLIAQVADTLLNMQGIVASFVVCERPDGLIGISARSMGQVNVQLVMEKLGGGGHLTNAATQLEGTIQEAEARLLALLNSYEDKEGLLE